MLLCWSTLEGTSYREGNALSTQRRHIAKNYAPPAVITSPSCLRNRSQINCWLKNEERRSKIRTYSQEYPSAPINPRKRWFDQINGFFFHHSHVALLVYSSTPTDANNKPNEVVLADIGRLDNILYVEVNSRFVQCRQCRKNGAVADIYSYDTFICRTPPSQRNWATGWVNKIYCILNDFHQ